MSYMILNGISSKTIPNLIIQRLAPITKPKMRTQVEVVDGRDGDIITNLGYESYEKDILIGLSWNYNIDQIIKYFCDNSIGRVTFSDEPDKYYNYQIIDEINFDRLLRFRQATVKLHVQPFKYPVENNSQIFDITTQTSINVTNTGNVYSRPTLKLTGSGNISMSLNNSIIFPSIGIGETTQTLTIDTNQMEAYIGTTLKNRSVIGDYMRFKINPGQNTISWESILQGSLTKIVIENYIRWI